MKFVVVEKHVNDDRLESYPLSHRINALLNINFEF